MTIDARRQHLLRAGVELLSHRRPEDVSTEEIAAAAGVSKGLLYHYFPTKQSFIVAALELGQAELADRLRPDPDLEPMDRLDASLNAFLDSVEENTAAYTAIFERGGAHPEVAATLSAGREQQLRMLLDALAPLGDAGVDRTPAPALEAALQGWLFFCEGVVLRWLAHGGLDRHQVLVLLRMTLLGVPSAAAAAAAQEGGGA